MAVQLRALAETDVRQPIPSSQLLPALQTPPFVPVPGTFNTRDLGLLEEEDNNKTSRPKIRPGFLYRSGSLDELRDHPAGQAQLRDELGVRRVFDLRSRAERAAAPDPEVPGVETVWLVPGGGCGSGEEGKGGKEEEGEVDEEEEERRRTRRTTVDLEAFVEGCGEKGYVAMYMDVLATYGAVFREVLRSVRDRPREGILFHCTGKFEQERKKERRGGCCLGLSPPPLLLLLRLLPCLPASLASCDIYVYTVHAHVCIHLHTPSHVHMYIYKYTHTPPGNISFKKLLC